jgi:hypothetical protein
MDLRIRELEGSSRVTTAQQHLVDALRNEVASLREDIAKVGREWQQAVLGQGLEGFRGADGVGSSGGCTAT